MSTSRSFSVLSIFFFPYVLSELHHYHSHDKVSIGANTVGPYNNPTETYAYYSLPFCSGTGKQRRHKQDLGETLSGSRKVATPYELTFLDPIPWRSLCEESLDPSDIKEFKESIEADYFFEMFIDDLPMWGYIGEVLCNVLIIFAIMTMTKKNSVLSRSFMRSFFSVNQFKELKYICILTCISV